MSKPSFVYVTYIATTVEKVWQALTDTNVTRRYWGPLNPDANHTAAFVIEDGVVHHTYSAYARGVDGLWGANQWLNRAPKGRNQQGPWWKRHDEYGLPRAIPIMGPPGSEETVLELAKKLIPS